MKNLHLRVFAVVVGGGNIDEDFFFLEGICDLIF